MEIFRRARRTRDLRKQLDDSRDKLYRVAYSWCHNPDLADDLVQQTLVKALQKSGQLREPSVLDSWLFRILANCWNDHFRRQRETVDLEDSDHWHDQTPEHEQSRGQVVSRVQEAIAGLPMPQREVVTLVDLGGLSYMEVAEVLEVPVGTVMSRLCRARRALKDRLFDLNPTHDEARAKIRRIK